MLNLDIQTVWICAGLGLASFCAGLIDAMAGGGGLIRIPALFTFLPAVPHPILLGTNKLAGVAGTANAAYRYSRVIQLPWNVLVPAAFGALLCGFLGAYVVTFFPPAPLKKALPVLLTLVAVYTFVHKNLGQHHVPKLSHRQERWLGLLVGSVIGFYDGFFGPGSGSFLIVAFVGIFGFDFLAASACSKVVNMVCNLASLVWFVPSGHFIGWLAGWMAIFNICGSQWGARIAIKKGAKFVRKFLLLIVCLLIVKTAWDAYKPLVF